MGTVRETPVLKYLFLSFLLHLSCPGLIVGMECNNVSPPSSPLLLFLSIVGLLHSLPLNLLRQCPVKLMRLTSEGIPVKQLNLTQGC